MKWSIELQGGAYDGWEGHTRSDLEPVLVAWACGPRCAGHATFYPGDPRIRLRTAEAYRQSEVDPEMRHAVYVVGESGPRVEDEARELVGAGGMLPALVELGRRFGLAITSGPLSRAWKN